MAERPGSGGPGDGPDFGWLYGSQGDPGDAEATRPVRRPAGPARPAPDETRVMQTQPRPGPAASRPVRPTPPPVAPPVGPPPPARTRRGGRGFRPRFRIRYVFLLLLLWLVYLVA